MEPKVIGYGPKSDIFPFIPKFLIIDSHGLNHRLSDIGTVSPLNLEEKTEGILYPISLEPDKWCAIEEDRTLVWFDKNNRKHWIADKALSLVNDAKVNPNPLKSVGMLKAAAKMCGFELTELLRTLESYREDSTESLEQIFKRLNIKIPKQNSGTNK
jgi:hypothetical protein